jgi:muramidase (phage lysozyme)
MANIYYGEDKIGTIRKGKSLKTKIKMFFKKVILWTVVLVGLVSIVQYLRWAYPTIEVREVIKEVVVERPIDYPVLKRIAVCESNDKHFGESGQVLMVGNTNKSVDVGRYQINSLWFKKANELGLDLTLEKDNEAFAIYLYKTYGTEPWIWSKKCWNK